MVQNILGKKGIEKAFIRVKNTIQAKLPSIKFLESLLTLAFSIINSSKLKNQQSVNKLHGKTYNILNASLVTKQNIKNTIKTKQGSHSKTRTYVIMTIKKHIKK